MRGWLADGLFGGEDARTFWIVAADGSRPGIVRLHDLLDQTPMFDVRIRTGERGRGLGTAAVRWLTERIFADRPATTRIEACTRADNVVMRRVLRKCGYVKEAHYRRAWPADGGRDLDSIGYGILREDWVAGTRTPVSWNDEPA